MYRFSIRPEGDLCGIRNLELDDALLGKPLEDMTSGEIEDLRHKLIDGLAHVALYTTGIPAADRARWVRFFLNAHLINVENVLLAWPAIEGASDEALRQVIAIGESFSIRVLFRLESAHAEEFGIDRYAALRGPAVGLYYDPLEYIFLRQNPFNDGLYKSHFKNDVAMLRICDMLWDTHEPKLPQHGNAQIRECASFLLCRSFPGYFSFSPYGCKPREVVEAFKQALKAM